MSTTPADEPKEGAPTMNAADKDRVNTLWQVLYVVMMALASFWFYQNNNDSRQLRADVQLLRESVVRLETKLEYVVRAVDDNKRPQWPPVAMDNKGNNQ